MVGVLLCSRHYYGVLLLIIICEVSSVSSYQVFACRLMSFEDLLDLPDQKKEKRAPTPKR